MRFAQYIPGTPHGPDPEVVEAERQRAVIEMWLRPVNPPCPTCKGTGGGQYNDCPTCDGNGVV